MRQTENSYCQWMLGEDVTKARPDGNGKGNYCM